MAGYGWNSRNGSNLYGFSHARTRSYGSSMIACRLCDHVCGNTQALINHIESHLRAEEEAEALRNLFANSIQPSYFSPFPVAAPPLREPRPTAPPVPAIHMVVRPPNPPPRLRPSDYTKPFLSQLEHPIREILVVESDSDGHRTTGSDELDLTLRL